MVLIGHRREERIKHRAEVSPALPCRVLLEASTQTSMPRPREMSHRIKELVVKSNNLSSNPETQWQEEIINSCEESFEPRHQPRPPNTYTYKIKNCNKRMYTPSLWARIHLQRHKLDT